MIIVGPLAPDQILEDTAQRPSASDECHSNDNSRRQVQDVRADSSALRGRRKTSAGLCHSLARAQAADHDGPGVASCTGGRLVRHPFVWIRPIHRV